MRHMIPIAFAFSLLLMVPSFAAARDAFIGDWKITVSPDEDAAKAGQKEYKDTLTFKGMKLTSEVLKKKGFGPADYTEDTRAGIAATFKCEAKSEKEGAAVWTGTSTANTIKGELTWTKPDGAVLKFNYTGERQN